MSRSQTTASTNVEETLLEFALRLAGQQEALGESFNKILYDNLWDLYVRSEPNAERSPNHQV